MPYLHIRFSDLVPHKEDHDPLHTRIHTFITHGTSVRTDTKVRVRHACTQIHRIYACAQTQAVGCNKGIAGCRVPGATAGVQRPPQ